MKRREIKNWDQTAARKGGSGVGELGAGNTLGVPLPVFRSQKALSDDLRRAASASAWCVLGRRRRALCASAGRIEDSGEATPIEISKEAKILFKKKHVSEIEIIFCASLPKDNPRPSPV